jgi:hypothetical protein
MPDADLVIEALAPLSPLLAGEIDAAEAVARGDVRITGDQAELDRFATLFRIPSPQATIGPNPPSGRSDRSG